MLAVGSVVSVSLFGQNENAKMPNPIMTMAPMTGRYELVVSVRWPGDLSAMVGPIELARLQLLSLLEESTRVSIERSGVEKFTAWWASF